MKPKDFRRIALVMPDAIEVYHGGQSQFRVGAETFATLEGPADSVAVVWLTPKQQENFAEREPEVFARLPGRAGKLGGTRIRVEAVADDFLLLQDVISTAWRNVWPPDQLRRVTRAPFKKAGKATDPRRGRGAPRVPIYPGRSKKRI
jgi:hypothetical protein